jgi:hypothetical protein
MRRLKEEDSGGRVWRRRRWTEEYEMEDGEGGIWERMEGEKEYEGGWRRTNMAKYEEGGGWRSIEEEDRGGGVG